MKIPDLAGGKSKDPDFPLAAEYLHPQSGCTLLVCADKPGPGHKLKLPKPIMSKFTNRNLDQAGAIQMESVSQIWQVYALMNNIHTTLQKKKNAAVGRKSNISFC